MKKIFAFVGASGSGKSTLGKYLTDNYDIEFREVSARPFLEDLNKSYDEQMNDVMQTRIMYNNLESVYEAILEANTENKNICLSRCCIDVLAYAHALNKGLGCEKLQENTIKKLSDKIVLLYTYIDFPMSQKEDTLRGINEKVRKDTDENIFKILEKLNIPHFLIFGDLNKRKETLDEIMKKYDIPSIK